MGRPGRFPWLPWVRWVRASRCRPGAVRNAPQSLPLPDQQGCISQPATSGTGRRVSRSPRHEVPFRAALDQDLAGVNENDSRSTAGRTAGPQWHRILNGGVFVQIPVACAPDFTQRKAPRNPADLEMIEPDRQIDNTVVPIMPLQQHDPAKHASASRYHRPAAGLDWLNDLELYWISGAAVAGVNATNECRVDDQTRGDRGRCGFGRRRDPRLLVFIETHPGVAAKLPAIYEFGAVDRVGACGVSNSRHGTAWQPSSRAAAVLPPVFDIHADFGQIGPVR